MRGAGARRAVRVLTLDASRCSGPRCVAAGVCGLCATDDPPDLQADVATLRYLDVCLVLATAPFVLIGGLPLAGYLIGAVAWLLTRVGTAFVHARARTVADPKVRAGLQVAGMMGRVWIVALAVIVARYAGSKDDGVMAAALVLAAFTVYFVMSFITREGPLGSPSTQGRASLS
jgi:hypothetical protein